MNTAMNGRRINLIDITESTVSGNPERHASGRGRQLALSATFHGDRDEFWIVETIDGVEIRRWNAKAVAYIEWVQADTSTGESHG
jgi:hypothetical protein